MTKKFYITTTLPYVNAAPHIGFALEIVQADAIARFHELLGDEVYFPFGTDEHGVKIYRKALDEKKDPKTYCDEYAAKFTDLKKALNLSYNNFVRTTDTHHLAASQAFWKRCLENGYINKQKHKIKYCVGCELEKTDSELENGKCPFHPNLQIETYDEENYFFKFSAFQEKLLAFYEKNSNFVVPEEKYSEIKTFVKNGLQDFSISRLKTKMPWGVDVPNDPDHVMYVWFDALVAYISGLGWPEDTKKFNDFWPGIQTAGKDNLRQQTAIWQAMLMAAGLPNSKQVYIHGFINVNGQKISKSLGNVINPIDLVKKYGTDAVRYFLLAKINPYGDSDFTIEKFEEAYNADLANGLGNLIARVAKLVETSGYDYEHLKINRENTLIGDIETAINNFKFDTALEIIWLTIKGLDNYLEKERPWLRLGSEDIKTQGLIAVLSHSATTVVEIAKAIESFLPETSEKILKQFSGKIVSGPPLFPRIS